MRWIFLALLVVNAVYAAWLWQRPATLRATPASAAVGAATTETLVLLREAERKGANVASARLQYAEPEGDGATSQPVCTLVGPFADILIGEQLLQRLQALEIKGDLRELEMPGEKGYWVYLAPEISKKEALRRLHELQAKGIDSFVIPKGELSNGISFGMYNQADLATSAVENLSGLGYDAQIKELERSYQERWLVLNPQEAQKVSAELWFQLQDGLPDLQHRQNFCSGVASSQKFL